MRWALVASTALFAVGAIAEPSEADTQSEPAGAEAGEHREGAAEPEARRSPRPATGTCPAPWGWSP
jgi:hypothetical protein